MKNKLALMPPVMGLFLLAGCGAPIGIAAVGGGGMYATQRADAPPADPSLQMAPHESWCYHTMGEEVECYAEPQDTSPGRLVNVDPPNRYPLTNRAYKQVLADSQRANAPPEPPKPAEEVTSAIMPSPVQATPMVPIPDNLVVSTKPPPKPVTHKKPKHHKKKVAKKPVKVLPQPVPNPTSSTAEPPDLTLGAPDPNGTK